MEHKSSFRIPAKDKSIDYILCVDTQCKKAHAVKDTEMYEYNSEIMANL